MVVMDRRFAALLDHAYAPSSSLSEWLHQLTAGLARLVPGSLGTVGRLIHETPEGKPTLVCPYTVQIERGKIARTLDAHQQVSEHRLDLVRGDPGLRSMRRSVVSGAAGDRYLRSMLHRFEAVGVRNMHHLTASDASGHTVSVGILSGTPERVGVPKLLWAVLEGHLATSLRLQVRLHHERALPPERSLHGALRALHVPSARRRALDRRRTDAVWRGVLDGTWTVIDWRDVGSRRLVIATPGDPDHVDQRALTERQARIAALVAAGHGDKEIAYLLDLARSTVTGYLQDALRKLHVPSRISLASAFAPTADGMSIVPRVRAAFELSGGAVMLTFDLAASTEPDPLPARLRARLSSAEASVAALALRGLTDAEIAHVTGRARHTVSNQLRTAYRRVGVHSRAGLAVLARELA